MSDWQKVGYLETFGSTWNINGIGKSYVTSVASYTQDVDLFIDEKIYSGLLKGEARFWFPGNGVDSYLVNSATISFEGKTLSLKLNNQTAFYVPKEGRWSDWISIRDWGYGHLGETITVTFSFSIANTSQKIPTAPTAPWTPVGVSAYEYNVPVEDLPPVEIDDEAGDYISSLPYYECGQNLDDWDIDVSGIGAQSVTHDEDGIFIQIDRPNVPENGASVNMSIIPFASHLPDKFTVEMITKCDSVPISSWTDFQLFLYTLDVAYVHGITASDTEIPGYEFLYKPLANALQKWRWEWDATNKDKILVNIFYDDKFIANFIAAFSVLPGEGYPSPVAAIGLSFNNHYDTGQDFKLHIKSISIVEGVSDIRALTEVTTERTITVNPNPSLGDTLTLKGSASGTDIVFTFVNHYPNNDNEIQIGANTNETAANIATAINNISGAEFVATAVANVVTVTAYTQTEFSMETDSEGLTLGEIAQVIPGFNDEEITATAAFTATEGGKAVQEESGAADNIDGLIDGISEGASVADAIDCLMDSADGNVSCSASADFDGLIDSMGDET